MLIQENRCTGCWVGKSYITPPAVIRTLRVERSTVWYDISSYHMDSHLQQEPSSGSSSVLREADGLWLHPMALGGSGGRAVLSSSPLSSAEGWFRQ